MQLNIENQNFPLKVEEAKVADKALGLDLVGYTPEQAENGQFQHRTHLFYVSWDDYKNHTMQGYSGIVMQFASSNYATILAFDYLYGKLKIGTTIDNWNNFAWRRTI